ncbi:hypothetical protein ml_261 [Mollivirus sibericum]|uniref:hypothetical protein n=1 Tax=Mollivirus sibericum TaxID=1678078 RepID=UPI0006B2DC42|nr:hypothetical protein ml_261 [Mollivirus sibericum]ALD62063.1 hypothetical protein ml_261 [Mollivirus sibericum]
MAPSGACTGLGMPQTPTPSSILMHWQGRSKGTQTRSRLMQVGREGLGVADRVGIVEAAVNGGSRPARMTLAYLQQMVECGGGDDDVTYRCGMGGFAYPKETA